MLQIICQTHSPERMEVPKKIIQARYVMRRGRTAITKKDNASNKCPRKEKTRPPQKIVNVRQHVVDRHLVNINMPQSSTQVCYINENASTLENCDTLMLGNHEESNGIEEISINYTSSGEVYDSRTTIVNSRSQPSLLKVSLPIRILRPWQSVRYTQTKIVTSHP
jgi:hypothetical protein